MTYKNIPFDQSSTMRSFANLAVKKGIITPESITKVASVNKKIVQSKLTPGPNLEENILKLCAALREKGFVKNAVEIEEKFFIMKKAVHLYDAHGETGDDVINFAHPDGSHQMKDVEGDAMIETIIDKQKAIKNMIAKEPTGKLAMAKKMADKVKSAGKMNNALAINAVKVVLAQGLKDYEGNAAKAVATTGLGAAGKALVSRIWNAGKNIVNKPSTIELADTGAKAGEVAEGGEAAAGAAATEAASFLPLIGAVIVGLVAGDKVANYLFETEFGATEIKEAADGLLNEISRSGPGMEDFVNTKMASAIDELKKNSELQKNAAEKATQMDSKSPPAEAFPAINEFIQAVSNCREVAFTINDHALAMIDKQTGFSNVRDVVNTYVPLGASIRNIRISAQNVIDVCDKKMAPVMDVLQKIAAGVEAKSESSSGGKGSSQILQLANEIKQDVNNYTVKVKSQQAPNAAKMLQYLDSINKYVSDQQDAFNNLGPNKEAGADVFIQKLNSAKQNLSQFAAKALKA
jgi:hypothetical protein